MLHFPSSLITKLNKTESTMVIIANNLYCCNFPTKKLLKKICLLPKKISHSKIKKQFNNSRKHHNYRPLTHSHHHKEGTQNTNSHINSSPTMIAKQPSLSLSVCLSLNKMIAMLNSTTRTNTKRTTSPECRGLTIFTDIYLP